MGLDLRVERLMKFDGEGPTKALADVAINEHFLIRSVRVIDGKNGLFVSMPRQKRKDGQWFDLVQTLNKDAKLSLEHAVLEAYRRELETATV